MILLPAIDLKDGRAVRLQQGDFATTHQVADDPVAVALAFRAAGAQWMHMVDLDGARGGVRQNSDIVRAVVEAAGLQVELGGGIRTLADLEAVFALGVSRAVIGSAAVSDPDFVAVAVQRYGERIAVGIDARDGEVRVSGWEAGSGLRDLDFARQMVQLGVQTLVYTDIATDGMLTGPSMERLAALQQAVDCRIVASGGVSSNEDLRALKNAGLYGAIIGKAYYTGAVDLALAIKEA